MIFLHAVLPGVKECLLVDVEVLEDDIRDFLGKVLLAVTVNKCELAIAVFI